MWLVVFSIVCAVGLFLAFIKPAWWMTAGRDLEDVNEALITMLDAGVGSSITTILGYLRHASEDGDFSLSYVPWYVARLLMGMLLGLIFYFVLKGGMLATISAEPGQNAQSIESVQNLNDWSLAGLGAMVGLFSKNAIEKLREVFNTLFQVQEENGSEDK